MLKKQNSNVFTFKIDILVLFLLNITNKHNLTIDKIIDFSEFAD